MLEIFVSKKEELEVYFKQLGDLSISKIKLWNDRRNSLQIHFDYKSKRKKRHSFIVTFVLIDSKLQIYQNLNMNGAKTPFELRVVFSQAIDLFINNILCDYHPTAYLKSMQVPIKYPASYLQIDKRKRSNRKG